MLPAMDLSFTLKPRGGRRSRNWVVSLADIKAAADTHRPNGVHISAAGVLRGQDETPDAVHVLACNIVPENNGLIDTVTLQGSFNPVVARQLMVGKIR